MRARRWISAGTWISGDATARCSRRARSGEQAAEADRQAARLALAVAVVRAYVQLDLQYALLDVTNDNLKQQSSILDLTQQRVSAGLENTARVKQSEGTRRAHARRPGRSCKASIAPGAQSARRSGRRRPRPRPGHHAPAAATPRPISCCPRRCRRTCSGGARTWPRRARRWRRPRHGIKAAEADFYPNVNLTAFAGFQAIGLSQLFDASDRIVGVGPAAAPAGVQPRRAAREALRRARRQLDQHRSASTTRRCSMRCARSPTW